jgi:hypothetical protein
MDHTGHSTIDITDQNVAMEKFNDLVKNQKMTAATRNAGETDYTVVKDPNDLKDETLFVPHMQGG